MDGSRGNDSVGESINIHAYVHREEHGMYTRMHRRGTAGSQMDIESSPDSRGWLEISELPLAKVTRQEKFRLVKRNNHM